MQCVRCGAAFGLDHDETEGDICDACNKLISRGEKKRRRHQTEVDEANRMEQLRIAASRVIVTTTNHIEGCVVTDYLGIESIEYVLGTGFISEWFSEADDFWGMRSRGFEKKLRKAKMQAFEALQFVAAEQGANAVIGIDMDFTEFSGNRVALILNGTLVRVRRVNPPSP